MGAAAVLKISVEEYLAADRVAEIPSEYYDGEVFPISAVSWHHGVIAGNTGHGFAGRLACGPCRLAMRVRVRVTKAHFVFPDLVIVCGKPALTDEAADTITNPKVIVEVMSPPTSDYDHGAKFALYRRVPSLEDYVLIAQDQPNVEVFHKTPEGGWLLNTYEGLEAVAAIASLEIALPLAELYAGIEFATP